MPSHPHDQLFRRIFSNPVHAIAELRTLLAPELLAALDLTRLEIVPGASYVNEELADREVDLLYEVPLRESAEPALVYVLLEHQSTVDPRMPARLLVYMARIWDHWMRANPSGKLPLIVPAVLHHSRSGWTAGRRLTECMVGSAEVRRALGGSLLDFEFFLDDLTQSTERELHERAQMTAVGRLALSVLRLGRSGEPADIDRWARLLLETLKEPGGLRAFKTVLRYLADVRDDGDDFIDVLVRATDDEEVEAIAMTYRERLIEQGRKKGHDEGVRRVLANWIQLEFGALSDQTTPSYPAAHLGDGQSLNAVT